MLRRVACYFSALLGFQITFFAAVADFLIQIHFVAATQMSTRTATLLSMFPLTMSRSPDFFSRYGVSVTPFGTRQTLSFSPSGACGFLSFIIMTCYTPELFPYLNISHDTV